MLNVNLYLKEEEKKLFKCFSHFFIYFGHLIDFMLKLKEKNIYILTFKNVLYY